MGQPLFTLLPMKDGQIELGRSDGTTALPTDRRMSRRHARIRYDGQHFDIEDLQSNNGTFVDGAAVKPQLRTASGQVLRTGESLFLLRADLRPYALGGLQVQDGRVVGPILKGVLDRVARAASFSTVLHVTGESGAGKEVASRAFHAAGPQKNGPFVAVNCATIPSGVAERVLFGARRGAFSGAVADSDGYIQAADGGTLFLDEIAELDLAVQTKLLRVLETREVCQLGSTRPKAVDIRLCSATNKGLRAEVAAGRFREDLYFRLSSPAVELPPLRQRREEIPWLIAQELKTLGTGATAHTSFVEACLLRYWPGNIRELLTAIRAAVLEALATTNGVLEHQHLAPTAGLAFPAEQPPEPPTPPARAAHGEAPTRRDIEKVLAQTGGNVSAAARLLKMHRTQLQRVIERLGIDVGRFALPEPSQDD
jgi:transcriptional regulator with GAF, ATPase, and Fis domain